MAVALPIWWFRKVDNVGDVLNRYLIPRITGHPIRRANRNEMPHILAIGSVLGRSTPYSYIWGTGTIAANRPLDGLDGSRIRALRGKLTVSDLRQRGITNLDVPLGDPAVLLPRYYRPQSTSKPFDVGVIAHYVDRESDWFKAIPFDDESIVDIDVGLPVEKFVDKLVQCRRVISSSLHGLILAESYEVPNTWIEVSDGVIGRGFKFRDWYSLSKHPEKKALDQGFTLSEMAERAILHDFSFELDDLLSAMPLAELLQELSEHSQQKGLT